MVQDEPQKSRSKCRRITLKLCVSIESKSLNILNRLGYGQKKHGCFPQPKMRLPRNVHKFGTEDQNLKQKSNGKAPASFRTLQASG